MLAASMEGGKHPRAALLSGVLENAINPRYPVLSRFCRSIGTKRGDAPWQIGSWDVTFTCRPPAHCFSAAWVISPARSQLAQSKRKSPDCCSDSIAGAIFIAIGWKDDRRSDDRS